MPGPGAVSTRGGRRRRRAAGRARPPGRGRPPARSPCAPRPARPASARTHGRDKGARGDARRGYTVPRWVAPRACSDVSRGVHSRAPATERGSLCINLRPVEKSHVCPALCLRPAPYPAGLWRLASPRERPSQGISQRMIPWESPTVSRIACSSVVSHVYGSTSHPRQSRETRI